MGEGLLFTLDTMMFFFFSLESQLDLEPWDIEDHLTNTGIHDCHLFCELLPDQLVAASTTTITLNLQGCNTSFVMVNVNENLSLLCNKLWIGLTL